MRAVLAFYGKCCSTTPPSRLFLSPHSINLEELKQHPTYTQQELAQIQTKRELEQQGQPEFQTCKKRNTSSTKRFEHEARSHTRRRLRQGTQIPNQSSSLELQIHSREFSPEILSATFATISLWAERGIKDDPGARGNAKMDQTEPNITVHSVPKTVSSRHEEVELLPTIHREMLN